MVVDRNVPVGTDLMVGGALWLGITSLGSGWWLAVRQGDPVPAPVHLVKEDPS